MRTWTTMLLVLTALAAHASPSRAEGLGRDVRQRCLQAVVRVEVDTPRGTVSGSGTLINSRGFILTNFHVVGHTSHRTGFPGTRHGSEFRIALTRDEREPVVDEFVAEVVRGNVELDLALLRIVRATAEGAALPESFPVLEMAPDVAALGTGVWALGFPDGLRTINLTAGQVAGFEKNDADEVAWLRTDTEFNPGNSGGALIDDRCRLVGIPTAISNSVEPIEFVRPATRVPAEWLAALESPEVVPQPTEGIPSLTAITERVDGRFGDSGGPGGGVRYYALPHERPAVVTLSPRLDCAIIGSGGSILRRGEGRILVMDSDPRQALLAVFVPRGSTGDAPELRLRFGPMSPEAPAAPEGASFAEGRITGEDCQIWVALGPEDTDLAALRSRLALGEITEAAFREALSALAPVGGDGSYRIPLVPGRHRLGFVGPAGVDERTTDLSEETTSLGVLPVQGLCGPPPPAE